MAVRNYVLENEAEFDRLERQAQSSQYSFRHELAEFDFMNASRILDAGCGSGAVSRYIAARYPTSEVIGIDQSDLNIRKAKKVAEASGLENLHFKSGGLTAIPEPDQSFEAGVCRFVLEHLSQQDSEHALREIFRCLKPGGRLAIIDIDGYFFNVFPLTPRIRQFQERLRAVTHLDMQVGRKIPYFVTQAGFEQVSWRIEVMNFQGDALKEEIRLIEERFSQTLPAIAAILGGHSNAVVFQTEYLETLQRPGAVLFYNKFIISCVKP